MRIVNAPEGLAAVVLVSTMGHEYDLEYVMVPSAIPLERRIAAKALRELADALEAQADEVGD